LILTIYPTVASGALIKDEVVAFWSPLDPSTITYGSESISNFNALNSFTVFINPPIEELEYFWLIFSITFPLFPLKVPCKKPVTSCSNIIYFW